MRDGKDNRICFHEKSGLLSALCSYFPASSAAGLLAAAPFSFTVGGDTGGDEAVFSAGIASELSEVGGGSVFSSAAANANSSLKASRAHAVAIWRNAKRAAPSRLSTAHWPQSFDNLQQSSADDVITPKRTGSFRHQVDHWR